MSLVQPELEYVDRTSATIRYLEHGWPSNLIRWHSHPEYELHLTVATSGKTFVGDHIGEFSPGSLYLIGPNLPHNWITDEARHTEAVEVRDRLIQFSQNSLDQLVCAFPEFNEMATMFELAKSGLEITGYDPEKALTFFERIRDESGADRILTCLRLLRELNEHADKTVLSVAGVVHPENSSTQTRIAKVVDYISEKYSENISLDFAAEMAGVSAPTFSRNFRRLTGNKFVDFVNRVRISQACSMLHSTEKQISTICFEVGFQNLANFNRQFLRMKGMTPRQFREITVTELSKDFQTAAT